jgi:hypothetical protein
MVVHGSKMIGDAEGVGEAVTGGLLARAVEPEAGEAHGSGTRCLNCGAELIGDFCHHCGQSAHVHRSLAGFGHDIAHGVLHFEGKIWRTLPMLAWRPGELTRRYIQGERARFVSPIALFLFSVFLMFAVFSAIGGPVSFAPPDVNVARGEIVQERATIADRIAMLKRQRAELVAKGVSTAEIDERIDDLDRQSKALDVLGGGAGPGLIIDDAGATADSGIDWFNAAYLKAKQNPSLLLYKLQTNAYKFSWALIPISVPFLWLLFAFRRRHKLYDHTVFVTYSIAFMTLLAIGLTLLGTLGATQGLVMAALLIVPPVHIYRQLKGAYELSRAGALWRTALLILFALIAATLFFVLLVAIGIAE